MEFVITEPVRRLGVRGAFAVLSGLDNHRYPGELERWRQSLAQRLHAELTPAFIEADPVLRGFRDLHDAVKRSNKRFVSSAEALVGLFQRKGIIPRINAAVDVYNAVSLETRLSLGAHDLAHVSSPITLALTQGNERFVPLGTSAPEPIQAGEYAYMDASGEVLCRLEHRQCEKTKVTTDTSACFYIIQGNRETPPAMLESALERVVSLTLQLCGGRQERYWIAGD